MSSVPCSCAAADRLEQVSTLAYCGVMTVRRKTPIEVPTTEPHLCTPAMRLQALAQVPLFESLEAAELAVVDVQFRAQHFSTGDAIYHTGEAASRFYVVADGLAKATRSNADGHETLLDILGRGDFLGALPALGPHAYADTAWAMAPLCLLGLDAGAFETIIEQFPSVARATLRGVSHRLTEPQAAVHLLAGASLEQRLAATLLLLAAKNGKAWDGGTLVQIPLSRDDLAAMTGAATESVSRLLSTWRRAGIIETGRRWIAICDGEALETLRDD